MDVAIQSAHIDDKSILRNLMELYVYDFSEYMRWDVDAHGLFGYKYLDPYWTEPDRFPFLIRVASKLAGLALVRDITKPDDEPTHSMAEFFILRKYRRQGVGRIAAHRIFDLFPGQWSVIELEANVSAQTFWRKVISEYTGGNFQEEILENGKHEGIRQTFRTVSTA